MTKLPMPVICECGFSTLDAKKAYAHALEHYDIGNEPILCNHNLEQECKLEMDSNCLQCEHYLLK